MEDEDQGGSGEREENFNRPLNLLGKLVEGASRANSPIQRQNIAVGTVEVLLVLQFREKKTWK
ncbi:hypothetical protein Ancab_039338 [Ancistrocladus abbreviatus]